MTTKLEARIGELEEELRLIKPGSEDYEHIAKDLETLYGILNDCKATDIKAETQDFERMKAMGEAEEAALNRKNATKRDILAIIGGTWIPFIGYMIFEERHVIHGKAVNWIGKLFRR